MRKRHAFIVAWEIDGNFCANLFCTRHVDGCSMFPSNSFGDKHSDTISFFVGGKIWLNNFSQQVTGHSHDTIRECQNDLIVVAGSVYYSDPSTGDYFA
jgi:hypothetical protein